MSKNNTEQKLNCANNVATTQRIPIQVQPVQNRTHHQNNKIHIRQQKGDLQKIRTGMNTLLVALFFLLPFISYQGRQAILFDLSEQQFIFFGTTLWPQDFTILAWVFIAAAFMLFFVTVFLGRIWCGYLCPQTAWTFIYVWIETQIEGNSNKRVALDKAPWSGEKLKKRLLKHSAWGVIALLTGCGFIAYFIPARELYIDIFTFNASFWVTTWVWFFAICTYLNAGWMREQMCLHCCPYSRFQSVMFDANTKTVTYNAVRGENRGPRKRNQVTNSGGDSALKLGDCVDCNLCVEVCPTGIDIRNGLQYECIDCGACVDACNQTMDKFGYQRNLISYTSENALSGKAEPFYESYKFIGYGIAALIMLTVIVADIHTRSNIELNVLRDRQSLYRETNDNKIENSYTLKIRNKTQQTRLYRIYVSGNNGYRLAGGVNLKIKPGEQLDYPVTVVAEPESFANSHNEITFTIAEQHNYGQVSQQSSFFAPI
ncbi:cytochrome c oxidase accessory protein CcoG [Shewanella sp. Isolate13]|uniref:cytochrome c oxidase accessory protein CcoG n=1 Tax=Shewanella sp. Isolate13 TaxID=2908531 RepID=UPI001EFD8B7C|nr:cytochrome c oxidase accessory protein CcoG [Shewanella sp. Isolate13]MCG9731170.1 cytochrome c oxidase accessory protein CcoG [Shewanella sp. Isolate13]